MEEIKLNIPKKYQERFGKLEIASWDCEQKYYLYFAEGWGYLLGSGRDDIYGCIPVASKKEAIEYLRDAVKVEDY